ncbi:peroxisomal half ABC transporter [Coccidioides immitis RMSCC 3703]|uniref:Peroxisomal half ABC transporter n=1 Tax=Coccidioides immitis RMSCC 3703 TaxID=454286 RepID=A0A0J8TUX7_COCIT|nr:peroxisomal half ABC transporter [Coccidioides immitis RMSCC 3703]
MAAQSTLRQPEDPLLLLFNHYANLLKSRIQRSSRRSRLLATTALLLAIVGSGVERESPGPKVIAEELWNLEERWSEDHLRAVQVVPFVIRELQGYDTSYQVDDV